MAIRTLEDEPTSGYGSGFGFGEGYGYEFRYGFGVGVGWGSGNGNGHVGDLVGLKSKVYLVVDHVFS